MSHTVNYEKAVLFEHQFWLQILGDHSRFILNSLSQEEEKEIERAHEFINIFDHLLEQARQHDSPKALAGITQMAYLRVKELRAFKLHLLKRHLLGEIRIQLPPTFLNHMLNELDEYMNILCSIISGVVPVYHPIHHHVLWLTDAVGHAASIAAGLDEIERELKVKSMDFEKTFGAFQNKAQEMAGYLRASADRFPALERFNCQVELEMLLFKDFLEELAELRMDKKVLGTLLPLIPDHMAREECYYLTKLSQVSEIVDPDCDPGRPRIQP